MGMFKSKAEKELDAIIQRLEMNMSNNYKDIAQHDLKDLESTLYNMKASAQIKNKVLAKYETVLDDYRGRMAGFTHKDQKPYWD